MKLIKISLLILISLRFDFSKACDPNENCMYLTIETCSTFERPFRVCRKRKEDLVCAAKRKLCQVNCSSINEDASNYISQYYSEIVRINSELTSLDNSIRYEQNNQENYLGSIQRLSLISENFKGTLKSVSLLMDAQEEIQQLIVENHLETDVANQFILESKQTNNPHLALFAIL